MPILYRLQIRSGARGPAGTMLPSKRVTGEREKEGVPIRIPADPEPHDPLVRKDRPKKVKNEEEIGDYPGDEAVEFGRSTARFGW